MALKDFYNSGDSNEISLRDEFFGTFDGTGKEISKKQPCLIRVMRRDANGDKVPCDCVDPVTREAEKDRFCPTCLAEGFMWDEIDSDMYKVLQAPKTTLMPAGLTSVPLVVFYMRHNAPVVKDDKLIELVLDLEGVKVQPIQRKDVYVIQHLEPFRLDTGRVEYLKLWTFVEDVKHLNKS